MVWPAMFVFLWILVKKFEFGVYLILYSIWSGNTAASKWILLRALGVPQYKQNIMLGVIELMKFIL